MRIKGPVLTLEQVSRSDLHWNALIHLCLVSVHAAFPRPVSISQHPPSFEKYALFLFAIAFRC